MLGNACFNYFNSLSEFETYGTWRKADEGKVKFFDARSGSVRDLINGVSPDWIINCIGVIKQKIDESDRNSVENTFKINRDLPLQLARAIEQTNTKVIQIATDCVFSGSVGNYSENSCHDALDLYGKSKSSGEINSKEFVNLRVSIIGREIESKFSIADWFLSQDRGASIEGYQNHFWNGITTLAFSRIAAGIIRSDKEVSGTVHIVPSDHVSKYELLNLLSKYFDRGDIKIKPINTSSQIDRTLCTIYPEINKSIWKNAGYESIPSIEDLIAELANKS